MKIEFRVLGPVALHRSDQRLDLGPVKLRCFLVPLVLTPNKPVSESSLVRALWDGRAPDHGPETLNTYATKLRRLLKEGLNDHAPTITSSERTYSLRIDLESIDLHRFRELHRQATAVANSGDLEHAVELLQQAEALWNGDALAGLPGDWIDHIRMSLEKERRAAILDRVKIELDLGRHTTLVAELHRLAADYAPDEDFTLLLMTALYRCGRQPDALNAYQQTRRHLEELGLDPRHPLEEIHRQVLSQDLELAVTPVHRRPGDTPQPSSLPPDIADFVGRHVEKALLTDTREPVNALAIEGMAGVGKTALAVHVAHLLREHYPDAQLFIDMRAHDRARPPLTPATALHDLLRMLEIPAERIPRTLPERARLWRAEMSSHRALIVLDDAASAEQIRPLLAGTAGSLYLITSRRRLGGLTNLRSTALDVLPVDDAAELFTRTARLDAAPSKKLANQIVRLCGGLPLAIKLTAANFRHGDGSQREAPPSESPELRETTDRSSTHEQITAAFDASYHALEAEQRRMLRRLALSPRKDVTIYAAAALDGSTAAQARPLLHTLTDHNLLQQSGDSDRYQFHDLVHAYAAGRAQEEDAEHVRRRAVSRLLDYYLHTADQADRILYPHHHRTGVPTKRLPADGPLLENADDARAWMESQWQDVLDLAQFAVEHEWKIQGVQLTHLLAKYLDTAGHHQQAIAAHELAVQACRDLADRSNEARAATELAFARFRIGDHDAALRDSGIALTIGRSLDDRFRKAAALDCVGVVHWSSANYRQMLAHCQEAHAIYRSLGDDAGQAETLNHVGMAYWHLGRYDDATICLQEALSLFRRVGDQRGEAKALNNLGDVHQHRGYHRDATEHYQQALTIIKEITGRQDHAIVQNNIGNIHQHKGRHPDALRSYAKAFATYRATGNRRNEADVLNNIGITYSLMERHGESLIHHQKALAISKEIRESYQQARALCGIADARCSTGRYTVALDHYWHAFQIARDIGDLYQQARILDGIARCQLHAKGHEDARIYWRQSIEIFDQLGMPHAETLRIRLQTLDTPDA